MVTKNTTCLYSHANQIYLFTLGCLICWFFRFLKLCSFQNSFSSTVIVLSKNWSACWLPGYNMVILLLILHGKGISFHLCFIYFSVLFFSASNALFFRRDIDRHLKGWEDGSSKLDLHQKLVVLFFLSCFITCKINSCCVLDTNRSYKLFCHHLIWFFSTHGLGLTVPPGSNWEFHGILQVSSLPFSRGFSQLRDQTRASCIAGRFFTIWATREAFKSIYSVQFSSVAQSCLTFCDPVNCSMPGLPVHHQLPEFTQTHIHRVSGAIQPSHPLSSPFPPAPSPSQHQSLFQWVNSSHEVAKVLEFQL